MSGSQPDRREDMLSLEHIRQLVQLMVEHELSELDLRQQNHRLRIRRCAAGSRAASTLPAADSTSPPGPTHPSQRALGPASETPEQIAVIRSPMVGTFYSKANPEAEPYVQVGDQVEPDTIVCIIEAMKVFNEIPAEVSGRIVAVLADNEEPVDYGKPLFKIDTSG